MLSELYKIKISQKWKLIIKINERVARLAQLVEHQTEDLNVPGSTPGFGKNPPSIAQLVERGTVVESKQLSLGHWFKSGSKKLFLYFLM